ncbi:MAG TPA: TIGR01620 family protein [Xanthobacteraceae bacterium]|nr:TIGR01620 family protein [Xanthobacteraceae bacterium]
MNEHPRRPAAFRLDDPRVVVTLDETTFPRAGVRVTMEGEPALPVALAPEVPARRRLRWGTLFWSALGGLTALGLGAGVARLIADMFDRDLALGWLALGLAAVAGVAASAIVLREALGLWRLGAIEKLRQRGVDTLASDDRVAGRAVARDVLALARPMPRLARRRARLEEHLGDIIDGADLVRLAERELLEPLDAEARRLVGDAAKRVSLVTAVSPRAAIDMLFVLVTAVTLVRRLAYLYGGRPGTLGLFRLMRAVIAHLALTGGMAASDSLIQQVLGHGLAAKVSVRLGEGVLNGLLTARVGLAAIEVTRPLPFAALPPPTITDVAGNLLQRRGEGKAEVATAADA